MRRRVALVGLGSIGRRHARLLLERGDVAVELVEPNTQALALAQRDFGPLPAHPRFEAMLDSRPDIVWIATPTPLHAGQAIAALDSGAHVFCEKPMSSTVPDARRMKAAAEQSVGVLNIGFYLHFWRGILRIKQWIDAGLLGNVLHAHARVGSYSTLVNSASRYQATEPGSLFFDYSHQPDLFYWLLDAVPESVSVAGFQAGHLEFSSAPNVADVVCQYRRPLTTTIHLNYVQLPERHEYEIVGDQGWAAADFFSGCVRYGSRAENRCQAEQLPQARDDIFRAEQEAFLQAVEGRRAVETSAADGLVSTAICAAALDAWRTGERVAVEAGV